MIRTAAIAIAAAVSLTCNDSLFEPGMEVTASFDVQQLLSAAEAASIPIDSLVIELRRASDSTIAHSLTILADSITVSPDGDTVAVDIRIPLESRTEEFYLTLWVVGDGIVWLEMTDVVTVEAGTEPTTTDEMVPEFVGPGANATNIVMSFSDTTITGGDSILVSCTVYEDDAIADSALVSFSSSDAAKVADPSPAGYGQAWVHAPAALTDSVEITAEVMTADGSLTTSGVLRFFARPQTLRAVAGDNQDMLVGAIAAEHLVVEVLDAAGDPFTRGFPVIFAVESGPANTAVSPTSVVTDGVGYASTELVAGDAVGTIQVSASASGLSGSPVTFGASVVPGAAATMVVNAGDGQSATVGTAVSTNPSVLVTDDNDDPVPNTIVTFTVSPSEGSVTGAVDTTDATGIATVGSWTLGTADGSNVLTATATGLAPVYFSATGTVDSPASLAIVSGNGQTGAGGSPLPQPLLVQLTDQYGNWVEGVQVNWATSFGSVDPTSSQTEIEGHAWTTWTLDPDATDQTATATVTGLDPATFTATLGVGAANITKVDGDNQTATVGATLPVSPSVLVTDGGGNPAADEEVTFAVASGGGSVVDSVATTDGEGMAQVGGWTLGQAVGTNTLTATVGALTPVTFTATGTVGLADSVVIISGNAQTADGGTDLPLPLVVEVRDQYGNPVSGETVDWQALNGSVTSTTSTTDGSGRAQTTWMLGMNSTSQTASATVGSLTPAVFSATATFPTPTILMALVGADRVSVGSTADLEVTLSSPAGAGGVIVIVDSDNSGIVSVQEPDVIIAEGNTTGQVVLNGVAGGSTTVRATATGYVEGTLVVESSLQVLSLPSTLNVPFGGTASLPLTISTPAPAGGEAVMLISSNPASVALVVSTVTIPEGSYTANATVSGVLPGTSTVTATSATHGSAQSTVSTTAYLNIVEGGIAINESFGSTITIELGSGGSQIAAPAGGVLVTLTSADPGCVSAPATVTIPAGLVDATALLTYGGSTTTQCNTTVTATATDITSDLVNVNVNPPPTINVNANTVGSGLQVSTSGYLNASNHGGVDVVITSSNPAVLLVSPDGNTAGTESITVPIAAGYSSISYYIQGVEGQTGTADITISAPGFTEGSGTMTIVQPAVALYSLLATATTLAPDDPFNVRIGIPTAGNTSMNQYQGVRTGAPGPLTVTITNSNEAAGQLVTTTGTGNSVTVEVPVGNYSSPGTVAAGGVAFDPLDAGTTTVSASIPGYVTLPLGYGSMEVVVSATPITVYGYSVGSGLQRSATAYLGGTNHGGVEVVVTSSDPAVMLVSSNSSTQGTESFTVPISDGYSTVNYYIHGLEGQTGIADVTVSATGFTTASVTDTVVQPALALYYLNTTTTTLNTDDPFIVQLGIANATQTAMYTAMAVRVGAPNPLTATVTSSDSAVGHLVTTALTDDTVTVEIAAGDYGSPSSVANGGVAFDPLTAGITTLSATIPGYFTLPLPYGSQEVTVSGPGITESSTSVASGLQRSASASLGASGHGGVDVTITSSDPAVMLVSPDNATAGTASITVPVADGSTSVPYYVQGVEGQTGTPDVTITAPGFSGTTVTVTVVEPALDIYSLSTTTTTLSPDDPFYMRVGIPYSGNGSVYTRLAVRAGAPGPLTVTVENAPPTVGQLTTSTLQANSVTVEIPVGSSGTPSSVATGGVAFDPLTAGTTIVSATIPGFIPTTAASQEVTVTAPAINLSAITTGSGLQRSRSASLGASNHGGVDVVISSSNPSVLLLSPDAATAGTEYVTIPVADGSIGFSYFVQGVEDATGSVIVTATADGFTDGTATTDVVQPAVDIYGLTSTMTTQTPDDPFQVRVGLPYSGNTYVQYPLQARAGAPSPLTVTITSTPATFGQLVTTQTTGSSVTVQIAAGESYSPGSVATGGVAFEPLDAGTTTVSATIPGFLATTNATEDVAVTASGITMYSSTVGTGLQEGASARLNGTDHGGVDVVITSSDPSVLLVSPDADTPGTASITVPVVDGYDNISYYVQGLEGQTGTVTVTATASAGFTVGSVDHQVIQPALYVYSIDVTRTTADPDDPFRIYVGIPNAGQTSMETTQEVRSGAPSSHVATVTSSDPAVGQLVTTGTTGGSVTVLIAEGQSYSPNTVATGGVAFDPLAVGTTTVSATIPGFVTLPPSGYGSVEVTVSTP